MKSKQLILAAVIPAFALLAGCDTNEGPAEEAGAEIDNAVESAGDSIEETGDKIEDKVDN